MKRTVSLMIALALVTTLALPVVAGEKEKEVTWRRISKRNEERRTALVARQQTEQEAVSKMQSVVRT